MRLSIRYKIILPFSVLLVFVGVVGTGVASTEMTNAAVAQFNANLVPSSLAANQTLSQLDAARTADLRLATDTIGVPEALSTRDFGALGHLLTPILANVTASTAVLDVLDSRGDMVLRLEDSGKAPVILPVTSADAFAQEPNVMHVLAETTGTERRAFVSQQPTGATLYWVGPIRLASGRVVGAALLGESLAEVARGIQASAFYDLSGHQLVSVLSNPPVLTDAERGNVSAGQAVTAQNNNGGHAYALFSTWVMRGQQLGYVAVQSNADPLLGLRDQLRLILTAVFTAAALLTLLVGTATASLLTRPVQALVQSMRAVSGGDLQHRATVKSRDEIGYLARTFNEMTASLEQKTVALEATTFATIEALARAIDARDASTFGHSARVAAISMEIADAMFMPDKEREALRRAALLHDIGKIGVQDKVLRKPGPLTEAEADEMREHSQTGYDMLKGLPFLKTSLPGVLYHHERWDGAGYPTGLHGTTIPLQVRILAVADVFDALTSDRPYRTGLSFTAASASIRNEAGLQFDPDVVSAFFRRREAIEDILKSMGKPGIAQAEPEAA
jgi:putative nucleotidyltransferase with HDIG domain